MANKISWSNDDSYHFEKKQQEAIDLVCNLVNVLLSTWPRQSGKTTIRKAIANRIIREDDA